MLTLGTGKYQRRVFRGQVDSLSAMANQVAAEPMTTGRLLARYGLPVPGQAAVGDRNSAYKVLRQLGLPVVVRPLVDGLLRWRHPRPERTP